MKVELLSFSRDLHPFVSPEPQQGPAFELLSRPMCLQGQRSLGNCYRNVIVLGGQAEVNALSGSWNTLQMPFVNHVGGCFWVLGNLIKAQ